MSFELGLWVIEARGIRIMCTGNNDMMDPGIILI